MKKNIIHIIIVLLFSVGSLWAQIKKADRYFDNMAFEQAIKVYKRAIKKNKPYKQEALIRLADCYRLLNDYPKAEKYYAEAIAIGGEIHPDVYYHYGDILKSNHQYEEALKQYKTYLQKNANDYKAKYAIKSCLEIKYWEGMPQEYEVKNIQEINTMKSEFCPTILKNQLIYSGQKLVDIVDFEKTAIANEPFLNIFSSKIEKNKIGSPKAFFNSMNSHYHDGPISFSADEKMMFLTRVDNTFNKRNKEFVNRAKIYSATLEKKKWKKWQSFSYNSDDYSCAHACISSDGNFLYFTSDMPGGFGGKDIWVCKKNGDSWDAPINLGFDINTSGDEMFPYIRKDNVLFFSSNGLPGFGGLDILSAKQIDGKWILNRNEGMLLNSNADDFGTVFLTDTTGYFSSNRLGGKGKDDVYAFKFTNRRIVVDGTVLITENINNPAIDLKVYLMEENGRLLDSTNTDDKGYFSFKNLDYSKTYMAQLESDDLKLKEKSRYYLADRTNRISRITHQLGPNKKFVFTNLPVNPDGIPDLYNEDDVAFSGNLLVGENPSKPLANKKIMMKNESGDILEYAVTDEKGNFVFRNIPVDQNYTLSVEDADLPVNAKILLTNKAGKQIKIARTDEKGRFQFDLLAVDKTVMSDLAIDDVELALPVKGYFYDQDKKALSNAKVTIFDRNKVIENIVTDEKGKFQISKLSSGENYMFVIDESDGRFSNLTKIYVADEKGRVYREIIPNLKGKNQFNLLAFDKSVLSNLNDSTSEDVVLKTKSFGSKKSPNTFIDDENSRLAGTLSYGEDQLPIANKEVTIKNEAGEVIGKATTNGLGSFAFRNLPLDQNYSLSIDDADLPVDAKIVLTNKEGKEIMVTRTDGKGKFNFQLLVTDQSKLSDLSVDDVELVMDLNGYFFDQNSKPLSNAKVLLFNKEEVVANIITDVNGKFHFKGLSLDKNYLFMMDESDPRFKNMTKLYVADAKGKIYREINPNTKGKFQFGLLEIDKTYLSNYFAINEGAEMVSMKTKTADTKTVQKTVQDDENSRLAGTLSYGDDQLPIANKEVTIKNEAGEVIGKATTNGLGSFAFRNLPLDQNYSLSIDDADLPVDAKIVLTNKAGKEIMVTRTDGKGKFNFQLLATDQSKLSDLSVEDVELLMDLNGYFFDQDSKPLSNAKVLLFNKEEVVANIITDVNGKFHFKGLSLDKNYLFMMDESDPRFKNMSKLYVADAKGKIYREIKPNAKGKFQFGLLDIDKTSLGNYFVNDPWLVALNMKTKQQQQQIVASNSKTRIAPGTKIESSISISETVLFGYGGYQLDEPSIRLLNKVLVIMNQYPDLILELRSHTDSRGPSEHNLWLSKKRANEGLNYLISRGINKSRLKGIGYGESKLVNRCHDGVECSEEEHANNRRLEFKLFEIAK